jgi:pimeloyl-ACP methyl ester carboxylesterase
MKTTAHLIDVPVDGGSLVAWTRGDTGPVVLAIHGISASHASWFAVADRLDGVQVLAPDLRGRGGSAALPGPFGMRAHAEDMIRLLDNVGAERAIVAGHSMGGYVAAVLAGTHPDRVEQLILVDGGLPGPSAGPIADPDAILDVTLGPAIARLKQTYPSEEAYRDFWRSHPSLLGEWNDYVQSYVDYDLEGDAPDLRSKVSEDAVRADGRDLLMHADVAEALARVRCPVTLLRAPRGLLNQPAPLIPNELVDHWRQQLPGMDERMIDDVNHYTILLSERGSSAVASAIAVAAGVGG